MSNEANAKSNLLPLCLMLRKVYFCKYIYNIPISVDSALHECSCAAGCQHRFDKCMYVWINSSHCCTIGTSAKPNLAPTRFTTCELLHFGDIPKEKTFHISSPKRRRRTVKATMTAAKPPWLQQNHHDCSKIYYGCFEMLSWPHRTSANIINTCFWLLETWTKCSYFIEENIRPGAQRLAFEMKYEYIVRRQSTDGQLPDNWGFKCFKPKTSQRFTWNI